MKSKAQTNLSKLIEKFQLEINPNKIKRYNEDATMTAKGSQKDQIQRQFDKTNREIDDLAYKLYGITEQEKKIIEKS